MERLNRNSFIFSGVLAAFGVFMLISQAKGKGIPPTESDLEKLCPPTVANMPFDQSPENPNCSYHMDQTTYNTLKPFGIVARKYWRGDKRFDAVLIASASKDSFHDPHVCFHAQGWDFESTVEDATTSKTRGIVPFSMITMTNSKGDAREKTLAAYFYKGSDGTFYGNTQKFKLGLFIAAMKGQSLDGVFYRVIPEYRAHDLETQKKDLRQFIANWVDATNRSSKGYL